MLILARPCQAEIAMPSTGRFKHIARFITVGKHLPTFLGMLITLSVLWLQLSAPTFVEDFIQRLEYLVYDQRLDIMPKAVKSAENKVVIVDLDERSL